MIFSTFNSDKGFLSKIGIFKRSFADIGKAFNDALSTSIGGFADGIFGIEENDQGFFKNLKNNLTTQVNEITDLSNKLFVTKKDITPFLITDFSEYEQDASSILKTLQNTKKDVEAGDTTWQNYFSNLKSGQKWQEKFVQNNDLTKVSLRDVDAAQKAAKQSALNYNNSLQQMTIGAKAANVALKALSMAGNMLLMWGVSEVVSGLYKMSQTSEEVANKAKTLGASFSSTKSELKDYKEQIEALYTTINDSGSSIDEVKEARIKLMSIQDQMIEKYGSEKETVEAITGAIQNEAGAWENLSSAQWKKTKADFNDNGFWDNASNFFGGYKTNIDRMMDEYGSYSVDIDLSKFSGLKNKNEKYDEFRNVLQDVFGADISLSTDGITTLATLSGDASEVYNKLSQLQDLAKNFNYSEDFSNYLEKLGKEASDVSDKYQEMYNQYVLQEKVFPNSEYSKVFDEIQNKYNAIKDATTNGDENAINKANEDYASYMSKTVANLVGEDSQAVISTFESMYPELQSIVDSWNFKAKIIPELDINTDDLKGLKQSDILNALTTDGIQDGEDAFNAILKSAEEYGIVSSNDADKVQKLLDLLVKWGILQKDVTEETKRTADATTSSFTKDPTDLLRDADDKDRKDKNINLADLKNRADVMKTIQKEIEEAGDVGVDTLQTLSKQFPEASEALYDYMTGVKNGAEFFSELEDKYDEDKNKYVENMVEKNQANEDFFNSLKANYPEVFAQMQEFMNQGNELLQENINNYINSIATEEDKTNEFLALLEQEYPELYAQLAEVYDNDKENFIRHIIAENDTNNEFIDFLSTKYPELANALATVYNNDVTNWATMEQAKVNISTKAMQQIAQLYKEFYEAMGVANGLEYVAQVHQNSTGVERLGTDITSPFYSKEHSDKVIIKQNPKYGQLLNSIDQIMSHSKNEENLLDDAGKDLIKSSIDLSYGSLGKDTDSSNKSGDKDSDSSNEPTPEDFDWIERKVKNIERTISNLGSIVDDTYSDWSKRNNALLDELNAVSEEIGVQEQAAQRYFELADSVGLDDNYKNLVQNGAFDVETITDDTLKEQIKNYQDYYDKATDAQDKVLELKKNYNDLNNQRLDHLTSEFEQLNNSTDRAIQNSQDILDDDYVNSSVKDGEFANQRNNYLNSISLKEQERQRLIDEFNATGIDINSEAGYQWLTKLQEVQDEIDNINDSLKDLNDTTFDNLSNEFKNIYQWTEEQNNIWKYNVDNSFSSWTDRDNSISILKDTIQQQTEQYNEYRNKVIELFQQAQEDGNSEAAQKYYSEIFSIDSTLRSLNQDYNSTLTSVLDHSVAEFEQKYNYIETVMKNTESIMNDDTKSYSVRNKALIDQISNVTTAIAQQQEQREKLVREFNESGIQPDTEEWYKWLQQVQACDDTILDLQEQSRSLNKQKFDDIKTQFENINNILSSSVDILDKYISIVETKGLFADESLYTKSIKIYQGQLQNQINEKDRLTEEMNKAIKNGVDESSEQFISMESDIRDVNSSILETINTIEGLKKSIRELDFSKFEYLQDNISNVTSEANYYIDLIDKMGSDLYNDQGNITKEGITTAALHLQNKDTYLKQAQGYANKIKEIEEQIANDPTNKDLLDKKQEYVEAQREAYLSVIDEKKAVEDLVKDGYQKQLDYIQKIIDKKKEQMDEESDAYEYQKSIAEKTANLSKLYKQKTALTQMNDDSEENLKKIQELKVSIEEAEKDLQETEYEKMKSDRQKQLDNLQDEFSDMIDNMTQNIDQNLIDIVNEVNSSSVAIINTLKELSGNSGLDLSDTISSIYNNGSSYSNLNTSTSAIGQNYSKTNEAINSLTTNIKNLISNMEKESTQKQYNIDVDTTVLNNKVDGVNNTIKNTISAVNDLNDTIKKATQDELSDINNSIKDLTEAINGNKNNNSNNELGIGSPIQKEPKDMLGSPIQKDITESRVDIPRLESANTDTNNSPVAYSYTHKDMSEPIELSDGTILLPVDNNELSFNNGMYEQLYNLSKDNFINSNINSIPTPVTTNSNISAPTTVTYAIDMGGVTVNDVNDPKEFAQQLRYTIANDAKTKKMLKASTIDQLRGRSEKEVYKYV
jgi:hypothetical protein